MNEMEDFHINSFFVMRVQNKTRGHRFTIMKKSCSEDIRKHSLSHSLVDEWNTLLSSVVERDIFLINLKLDEFISVSCRM